MSEQEMAMSTASTKTTEPAEFAEFRRAERNLWDRYDLQPEERLVSLGDDRVVRIHDIGDGEPVLFVHGTGGSGVYFAPLVKALAPTFRCILMDRPGWTLSSPIDYSAGDFGTIVAQFQEELLTSLGISRAHVVGGSIGNLYALRLALSYPDRVGNIVLFGGLPAEGGTPPMFLRLLRTPLGQIMIRIPQRPQMIRKQLEGLGHKKSLDRGVIPDQYINAKAAESRYTSAFRYERELVRSVIAGKGFQPGITLSKTELDAIQAPTLMVYGSDDPLGSKELWSDFMASLPNGSLHVAPDSGHLPWFDNPEGIISLTLAHLQTPSSRT
jgi:pimeloyl-ACP methyl ester carboxylesterase